MCTRVQGLAWEGHDVHPGAKCALGMAQVATFEGIYEEGEVPASRSRVTCM